MRSGLNVLTFGVAGTATKEPIEVDPREALRNMRLRSKRALLESHVQRIGGTIADDQAQDLYDIQLKRDFSRAAGDDWEIVLLEVPRWILSDGDKARDLDAIRHGFRRKTVRFVSPQLDVPCPAVRRVFQVWKENDEIDAKLIPWADIEYLETGETTLAEVLSVDSLSTISPGSGSVPVSGATPVARDRVFISYSHADPDWFRTLEIQLAGLKGRLDVWSDEQIPSGTDWFPKIQNELDRAKVAILLVTPEFVASDFIRSHEVPKSLDAAKRGELRLFWILVSDCHYEQMGLDAKQAPHDISRPLDGLSRSKRNQTLKAITKQVLEAYEAT